MVRVGIILAIVTIVMMEIVFYFRNDFGAEPESWKTMVFTTLCLAQMGHALAVRSDTQLTLEMNPFSNPFLLAAVMVTSLLQLALIYLEPLRNFFGTHWLSPLQLAICIGFSALIFVWIEGEKLFVRLVQARR